MDSLQEKPQNEQVTGKEKIKDSLTLKRVETRIKSAIKEQNEREQLQRENQKEGEGSKKIIKAGENKEFFELQYVSPMIQDCFSNQLQKNHHTSRRQKVLKIQKETDAKIAGKFVEKIQDYIDDKAREKRHKQRIKEEEWRKNEQEALKALAKQSKTGTKSDLTIKQVALNAKVSDADVIARNPKYE